MKTIIRRVSDAFFNAMYWAAPKFWVTTLCIIGLMLASGLYRLPIWRQAVCIALATIMVNLALIRGARMVEERKHKIHAEEL